MMLYQADLLKRLCRAFPDTAAAPTGPPLLSHCPCCSLSRACCLPPFLPLCVCCLLLQTCFSLLCPSSVKPAVLPAPLFMPENLGASHLCLSSPLECFPHQALLIGLCVFFHLLNGNHHVLSIFVFPAPSTIPAIEEVFNQYC